jgi:hypothetical protein
MKFAPTWIALALALAATPAARASTSELWSAYLDLAYVYSSADAESLRERLARYGREAGVSLEDYITTHFDAAREGELDEAGVRRKATAYLLHYLAHGEPDSLDAAVDAIRELEGRLERHENRYWFHYILAHRALERGHRFDFVGELLDLWLKVVTPLESPYEALQTLSLSESPNSGFVAALPYIYENVSRIILIRSQQMGQDRDLDPLASIVRLLHDGRVGAHPDVIPAQASSHDYLVRILERLEGAESDAGSLTFTLTLFEASKYHDEARSRLASGGLGPETLKAIRVASGAYETALNRAETVQGQAAVYTRVLRQIGEIYAAKQRLGVDPDIETPFSIEGAIEVYASLSRGLNGGWKDLGYHKVGRPAYVIAMRRLWEEIQETALNAADYYLSRTMEEPALAGEHGRNAARLYSRYLSFFYEHATEDGKEGVPDSAYFAAHEAAKGVGDAYLLYSGSPTPSEIELATRRYRSAMMLFPFDRELWPALTAALERQGREAEYLDLVRPAAESVTKSRSVNTWIENGEPGSGQIETLRRALSDNLVIMHLGFAEAAGIDELELSLADLRARRGEIESKLRGLTGQLGDAPPAAPAGPLSALERAEREREIEADRELLLKLDRQIEARSRALPLYRETLATDGLADQLRSQRDHPVHTLLRRMYHERRA